MPFTDDFGSGNSGWAETLTNAAKPVSEVTKTKPTKQEIADAWNENRGDPAKVHQFMKDNNVGVKELSGILGASQNDFAGYLNAGRYSGSKQKGFGDDMSFEDQFKYDEVHPEDQTKEEFDKSVEPWMLDESGKFKRPHDGVNYRWEGMTPDQVWAIKQQQLTPFDKAQERDGYGPKDPVTMASVGSTKGGTYGGGGSAAIEAPWDPVNLKWEPGPDNGGGMLGGVARAIGNTGTAVVNNPALLAAATAGISSYMAPASVAGDVATAAEMGGNTTNAALYGNAGYGTTPTALQSAMASPYAQPAMSAGKTLVAGGSPADALRSAAGTYLGNEASGILGGGAVGQIGGGVVSSVVKGGNPLNTLVSAGVNAAASEITGSIDGFSNLSAAQQATINSMVAKALQGKDPTKGLIDQVTNMAMGEVTKTTPKKKGKTGGWAA